jgi:hypothetical protein
MNEIVYADFMSVSKTRLLSSVYVVNGTEIQMLYGTTVTTMSSLTVNNMKVLARPTIPFINAKHYHTDYNYRSCAPDTSYSHVHSTELIQYCLPPTRRQEKSIVPIARHNTTSVCNCNGNKLFASNQMLLKPSMSSLENLNDRHEDFASGTIHSI